MPPRQGQPSSSGRCSAASRLRRSDSPRGCSPSPRGRWSLPFAFELFEPAHREAGLPRAPAALLVGAATFIAVDLLLQRHAGARAGGLAMVAAATLDGVPENLARGVRRAESGSYALLAIVLSNLPEGFGGGALSWRAGSPRTSHPRSRWAC